MKDPLMPKLQKVLKNPKLADILSPKLDAKRTELIIICLAFHMNFPF